MAIEPVSLFEAREHLRIDTTNGSHDEDALIQSLIEAARLQVEATTGRTLVAQTRDEAFDYFMPTLELPHGPVSAVTWIKYVAEDEVLTTLSASLYRADLVNIPARITPAYNQEWPTTLAVTNAVQVRYETSTAAIPATLKRAVMLLAAHWYESRVPVGAGSLGDMPHMVADLVGPYRVMRL